MTALRRLAVALAVVTSFALGLEAVHAGADREDHWCRSHPATAAASGCIDAARIPPRHLHRGPGGH